MPESRRDQPVGRLDAGAALTPAHAGGGPLEIRERLGNRSVVAASHGLPNPLIAHAEEDAHALRRRERQVEAGNAHHARAVAERHAIGSEAAKDPTQRFAFDGPNEAERRRPATEPRAARFGASGVVVLETVADALDGVDAPLGLVEVILGLAGHEFADREHEA